MQRYRMFIGGEWVEAASGETFPSDNPYTAQPWALIPRAGKADVDRAVEAAHKALTTGEWPKCNATKRGALLRKLGDLITEHSKSLAATEVRDNGKLYAEMSAQTAYMAQWYYYFGGLADKIEGAVIPIDKPDTFNYTRHEPLGVIAMIIPWNSPLLLLAWKLAPALAAGNTVVVKPSEYTSASALEFMKLIEAAGFPPGVVNVVTGFGAEAGTPLVEHPKVAKVAFTGSDATGQRIYEAAAKGLKRVSMELGGKSPNIVFDDAQLDNAVKGVISGIFAATGQTCIAGSRLLVQRSIHDPFVEKLVALAKT
ncbi:MAG: aldehyde dehydrogenase family protein, partial [Betaproteobacteria bacterium]